MTNHISRELAEEIAKEAGMAVAPAGNGYWDNSGQLQTLLNLAIDKVIGEPVAWKANTGFGVRLQENLEDKFKTIEWYGKPMWEPLYALKEVK